MADIDDTPATSKPPARRAPRKAAQAKPTNATPATDTPAAPKTRRKPAAAKAPSPEPAVTKKPSAPPKPRSSKRATPPTKRATTPKPSATPVEAEKARGWKNKAAIAGGLAAVGAAATAALLSLRGSTPKKNAPTPVDPAITRAHTADGTDATASFEAGIADENTIPE